MAHSTSNDNASTALLSRRRLLLRMGMIAGVATATYAAPAMMGLDAARASGNSGGTSAGTSRNSRGASGQSRGHSGNSRGASGQSRGQSRASNGHSRGSRNSGRADAEVDRLMRQVFGG